MWMHNSSALESDWEETRMGATGLQHFSIALLSHTTNTAAEKKPQRPEKQSDDIYVAAASSLNFQIRTNDSQMWNPKGADWCHN